MWMRYCCKKIHHHHHLTDASPRTKSLVQVCSKPVQQALFTALTIQHTFCLVLKCQTLAAVPFFCNSQTSPRLDINLVCTPSMCPGCIDGQIAVAPDEFAEMKISSSCLALLYLFWGDAVQPLMLFVDSGLSLHQWLNACSTWNGLENSMCMKSSESFRHQGVHSSASVFKIK